VKKIILLLSIVLFKVAAGALPLLAENAATRVSEVLTLYPDHEDKNKFYFFPNSSMMVRSSENIPSFSLTYYGLENSTPDDGGAYMVFSTRLKSDSLQKKALEEFLAQNPNARIGVLPVQASTIGLTSTTPGVLPLATLFKEFNFSQKAGRAEDEIGVSAVLTEVGARVFRKAVLGPGDIFKADYCYKVVGLGPAMDAKVTARMDRVYDYFRTSVSYGALWWGGTITKEVESLIDQRLITYEVNGGDAKDIEYVRAIVEQITKRIFIPELNMSHSGDTRVWSGTPFSLNLNMGHREELKEETWYLKERKNIEQEFCVPMVVRELRDYANQLVRSAD
jgi:hypothetical protein